MRPLLAALLLAPSLASANTGSVAVLYFDNQGNPELEPLKVGLAQMLITDLSAHPEHSIVERARIQDVLDELQLGHSGMVDTTTAARVGALLGAEYLVLGSYFELMGQLRIDARVVRVETGEIVYADGSNGHSRDLWTLEDGLAGNLHIALSGLGDAPATTPAPRPTRGDDAAARPAVEGTGAEQLAAAVAYSEGLIALDSDDPRRAHDAFSAAVAHDPSMADAQQALASLEL